MDEERIAALESVAHTAVIKSRCLEIILAAMASHLMDDGQKARARRLVLAAVRASGEAGEAVELEIRRMLDLVLSS